MEISKELLQTTAKKRIKECLVNKAPFLDLSYLGIVTLESIPELFKCTHLKQLNLHNNNLISIIGLEELTALNRLDLRDNEIKKIDALGSLKELIRLDLSSNQISNISILKKLKKITRINLSSNLISDISSLKELTELNILDLSYNQIEDISYLSELVKLKTLDISYNQITDINYLNKLSKLSILDISYNQIININTLKNLTKLNRIDVSSNQIINIDILSNLTKLNKLNLSYNQISDISSLKELTKINELSLSYNQITTIDSLKNLTELSTLGLTNNQIKNISTLRGLTALKCLDLSANQITEINDLNELKELESLYLSQNYITDVSGLKELTKLNRLNLNHNQITDIHPLLFLIEKGIQIDANERTYSGISLYNNPLIYPPVSYINQGNEATIRFFNELNREDVVQTRLFEAKVLLLGEGGTGKTSLITKILDENKELPAKNARTRGIDIHKYKFSNNDISFLSHIWDFGGQDILHQAHRFFISDDALYIIVTDSRVDQGNKYEEWLQNIEVFTKRNDNKIILLQNLKYGDTPATIDIAEFRRVYSIVGNKVYNVDLNLTTSQKQEEFRNFKKIVEHRLFELSHVKKPILSHWLAIRKKLGEKLDNGFHLISFNDYTKICECEGLTNRESQKDLLRYLHNLGIVLWYEDYLALKQKVILNPKWVTHALYKIIDSLAIRNRNGKLIQEDVETLWSEDCYVDYQNELLEMLKVFRLAYKRKHQNEFIVPSLMNAAIPEKHENWSHKNSWLIKYKYKRLMPRGIVNQLTAELSNFVESDFDDVWAFGVVLTTTDARAKIEVNRNRKRIEVCTTGDNRLFLLEKIVSAMSQIHDTYKGLHFDINLPCNCSMCNKQKNKEKTHYKYFENIMLEIKDHRDDIYCRNLRKTLSITKILKGSGFSIPYKLEEIIKQKEAKNEKEKEEVKNLISQTNSKLDFISQEVTFNKYEIVKEVRKVDTSIEQIHLKLDDNFNELMNVTLNSNLNEEKIINAIKDISENQKEEIYNVLLAVLSEHLTIQMSESQKSYFEEIKKSNYSLDMKIKASIPLINLLGLSIGIEGNFDIKSWCTEMYDKYKNNIFTLFN